MNSRFFNLYALLFVSLLGFADAEEFPFATDTFRDGKLQVWGWERARTHRDKTIGNLRNISGQEISGPDKDAAADPSMLATRSETPNESKEFNTVVDLTNITGFIYLAIHVDDIANLTITEIDGEGKEIGTPMRYNLPGNALWRAEKSYKEFPDPIPGGKKYKFYLKYTNTINLTKQYNGLIDHDGANVYLIQSHVCPDTKWQDKSIPFTITFKKDSVTHIPKVKILEDTTLTSTFIWEENSALHENVNMIKKLRNPALVYAPALVKIGWDGFTLNLLVTLEGHATTDFMRIDNVKVGVVEWQDAQSANPNKPQTTVNGATVLWGWSGDDAIATKIAHEGHEVIELDHISSRGNVKSVTQEDGTEGVVLNEDLTKVIYPGDFMSPEMSHNMKHKVSVNCK